MGHMARLIELAATDAVPTVTASRLAAPLPEAELARHKPDRHLMLVNESVIQARASCWWLDTPTMPAQRVGVIGHYAADDERSGVAILLEAAARLAQAGCTIAVGPMDGNTWRRYRLVIERGSEPPFFLEPDNPDAWPAHFARAGFGVLATYTSALTTSLEHDSPRLDGTEQRLRDQGVTIRSMAIGDADDELRRVFRLSLDSFRDNYLYTPISEQEFLEQNRLVLPFVLPDLVLLAEGDGGLAGFVFALPDVLQRQRGSTVDTLIIKTLAVSPAMANLGLGGLLVGLVQRRARARRFTRAIHALMHERNVSQKISGHYAQTIRRYALFARDLSIPLRPGP
jgi:GNAT superfamily N-acetyltransferase